MEENCLKLHKSLMVLIQFKKEQRLFVLDHLFIVNLCVFLFFLLVLLSLAIVHFGVALLWVILFFLTV